MLLSACTKSVQTLRPAPNDGALCGPDRLQGFAPTSANLLATVTTQILQALVEQPSTDPRWGLYHLVASGQTTWHAYACYVIAQARKAGWPIKIQEQAIHPIATKDYPVAAPRPLNSRLDTQKLCKAFELTLPDWRTGVDEVLQALKSPA